MCITASEETKPSYIQTAVREPSKLSATALLFLVGKLRLAEIVFESALYISSEVELPPNPATRTWCLSPLGSAPPPNPPGAGVRLPVEGSQRKVPSPDNM